MTALLRKHNIERPNICAEIIISHTLKMKRVNIFADYNRQVSKTGVEAVRARCGRLAGGEPIQIILGDAQFFSNFFKVMPGVFIPRPETETLVEVAVKLISDKMTDGPKRILDLCAGTGVVCLSTLSFLKDAEAEAVAVEIDPDAAKNIAENAASTGLGNRLRILRGDLYEPLGTGRAAFDAILANPPYIPTADIPDLPPVVRDHDPHVALDGGPDGLDTIKRIIAGAPGHLKPGGLLALEVGAGQAGEVRSIMKTSGFVDCVVHNDLGGIERVVTGWQESR